MVTPTRTTQPPAPPHSGCGSPRGRSHFWIIPTHPWGSRGWAPASLHTFLVSPVLLLPPGRGWAAVGRYLQPCCSRSPVPGPPLLSVASRNGLGGRVTRQPRHSPSGNPGSGWGAPDICLGWGQHLCKMQPEKPGPLRAPQRLAAGSTAPGHEPQAAQLSKGPMRVPPGCGGGCQETPGSIPAPPPTSWEAGRPPSPSLFSASEGGTERPCFPALLSGSRDMRDVMFSAPGKTNTWKRSTDCSRGDSANCPGRRILNRLHGAGAGEGRGVAQLTKKVRMLSMSVREKVSLYLIEQSRLQQTKNIILPLSRQELADYFGIQKYSLLRCLNELKQEGVIRVEGRHIHILSPLLIS